MLNPLFSPHSMYWRVNREWLIALAGPRAVLLELAHPGIAAGVAQHSNYQGDPFGRLFRTMKTMTEISFGDETEMRAALKHFHKCHGRVHSSTENLASSDVVYDAHDPQLQFWVLATLIDSVLRAYERFVAPLSDSDKGAYYDDCVRLALRLGIARYAIPSTYSAFNAYMDVMLCGDTLHVREPARAIVAALFAPTVPGQLTQLFGFAGIGMLPDRLREEYGFGWSERREKNLERLAKITRRVRPWIPNIVAIHPKAWTQERAYRAALVSARS